MQASTATREQRRQLTASRMLQMGMEGFSAAFCGNAGGFAGEGGLVAFCSSESAWLATYAVFFFLLVERYFEIHRMGVSCPPAHLPAAFQVKQASTASLCVAYLVLLGLVVAYATAPPPVLLWSLSAHALLWVRHPREIISLIPTPAALFFPSIDWTAVFALSYGGAIAGLDESNYKDVKLLYAPLPWVKVAGWGSVHCGGIEGLVRLGFFVVQHTVRLKAYPVTFGEFLQNDGGLSPPLYFGALLLYGAASACQVVLSAVCLLHPNDLPLELLPFVARLLTQGSATLPCYTLSQPLQRAGAALCGT